MTHKLIKTENYLLVVDESEIKEGKTFLTKEGIIHTNIGWNYGDKVITAHLPLNGSPFLEGVPLLPPIEHDVDLKEILSEYAHNQWGGWMEYLFSKGQFNEDGTWKMPKWAVDRWSKQMMTKYEQLSEEEKDSDRKEADGMIEIFNKARYKLSEYHWKTTLITINQYPTEFECEMYNTEDFNSLEIDWMKIGRPKTITTAQGVQWAGKYK